MSDLHLNGKNRTREFEEEMVMLDQHKLTLQVLGGDLVALIQGVQLAARHPTLAEKPTIQRAIRVAKWLEDGMDLAARAPAVHDAIKQGWQ